MTPVIHTLRKTWPDCKITWIIGKLEAGLLGDLPGVEFITFDKSGGLRAFRELRRALGGRKFDILLHMQVAIRASLICALVKAPVKLGFDRARAHDYQWLFTNHRIAAKPRQHVLDGFFGFLEALGIEHREMRWDIPILEAAENFAAKHLPADKPVLAINPCSSARSRNWRNWPAERYAEIADYAAQHLGYQIVLTGGPAAKEREFADTIVRAMKTTPINLVGKTSLKEMLAVLKQARILIAPDTGPAHMATAVGTPVIGLYAGSNPLRTGPYLNLDTTINRYPEALQRYNGKTIDHAQWGERVRHLDVMRLITIEDVRKMLDKLAPIFGQAL